MVMRKTPAMRVRLGSGRYYAIARCRPVGGRPSVSQRNGSLRLGVRAGDRVSANQRGSESNP